MQKKKLGISQKDFAEMLDMPATTLSNYENGNRSIGILTLKRIASALGVTMDDLTRG